jgi:very-short-patch-repair endonuclease
MRKGQIKNVTYLGEFRRILRKNVTPAEAALWNLLKNKQLDGRKFRRQVSIENYIVDFYCAEEKLVIELDGSVHNHPAVAENDMHRDQRLQDLGYTVLRFENKDVFQLEEWVLQEIKSRFSVVANTSSPK